MENRYSHDNAYGTVKSLLGISDDDMDKNMQAEFTLNAAEELVLNYCNIMEIPAGLENTIVKMAIDMFRNEAYGSAHKPQVAKSVIMGDTKTDFATVQSENYEASMLKCYKRQLNRYRRVF